MGRKRDELVGLSPNEILRIWFGGRLQSDSGGFVADRLSLAAIAGERQQTASEKHLRQCVERVVQMPNDRGAVNLQESGGLVFEVLLDDDASDQLLVEGMETFEAALDVNYEQDHVLEGMDVVILRAGAEAFAAEQGGKASDFDRHAEIPAEQGDSVGTVDGKLGSKLGERAPGLIHAPPPKTVRAALSRSASVAVAGGA